MSEKTRRLLCVSGVPLRAKRRQLCYPMTAGEADCANLTTAAVRKRSPDSLRSSSDAVISANSKLSAGVEHGSEESSVGQSSVSDAFISEKKTVDNVPKGSRYSLTFPVYLERLFAGLDDTLIPYAQCLWENTLMRYSAMGATTLTAIETALPAPGILYALGGRDAAAGLWASVLLVLAIVSQVPKKFIWRPRPWMAGRAKPHRRDRTSSFPSRAVVCGVVFTWLLCASLAIMDSDSQGIPRASSLALVALAAAIASIARVACGAHYPSDCICGLLLGVAVVKLGGRLEVLWLRVGSASLTSLTPNAVGLSLSSGPFVLSHPERTLGGLRQAFVISSLADVPARMPLLRMACCIVASYAFTIASISGFWVKCSYVYGMLLSVCTFRFVFLAPVATGVTLASEMTPSTNGAVAWRIFVFAFLLAFGMATRGKKGVFRIAAFTIIYFSSLFALLWFRTT